MPVSVPHSRNETIKAFVSAIIPVAPDIRIIRLRPEKTFSWRAGQYVNISFGGFAPRAYSIAVAPGSGGLEVHIKRGKGDASSYVMDRLAEGEEVVLSGPEGTSVYDESIDAPVLALAGGLGIAPIKAIAEAAAERGFTHPFILYWGTSNVAERYLNDYFEAMAAAHANFVFHAVTGYPVTEVIARDLDDISAYYIYISGPPAMIAATVPLLRGKGADPARISYDRHPEAADLKP